MSDTSDDEQNSSDASYEPSDYESTSSETTSPTDDEDTLIDDIRDDDRAERTSPRVPIAKPEASPECSSAIGRATLDKAGGEDMSHDVSGDVRSNPLHPLSRDQRDDKPRCGFPAPSRPRPVTSGSRNRNTVFCFFCEESVKQFPRHLRRSHPLELEVQRIEALTKKSKKRKRLISILRNKGNFLLGRTTNTMTPVRRPYLAGDQSKPLPCTHCYGLFAKKQLWRHVRRCPANERNAEKPPNYQNLAQNLLLTQVQGNEYLTDQVFPRMRADQITQAVKTDPLICAYGSRFSKTHRDSHQVNLVSRKMRELGKLMIEINRMNPQMKSLADVLKPSNYKLLVECTKVIAGFNDVTRKYKSPTYAMNIQTTLKECCELACSHLYQHATFPNKTAYEEAEFPFRRLVATITDNWKYDVSHDAANTLHTAGMNKITIVPLATDLHKFRQYLVDSGRDSAATLRHNGKDERAFKNLTETVYCRVMLLCRKRCGELSRLTVELYNRSAERHSYEEFAEVLRPSEMLLVRKFKRVVIQGKRKATPVIFTDDVQLHIQTLLNVRGNFLDDGNPYLFGNPRTSNPIPGYKVVKKHALRACLSLPEAITTRCLRKHLATVCQLLAMTDQDIEQLATFMGHGVGVHRSEYRLPDDIFQTAKVAKLLLMMESGRGGQFKGKTLEQIDLDMEEDILVEGDREGDGAEGPLDDEDGCASPIHGSTPEETGRGSVNPAQPSPSSTRTAPKKFNRVQWTDEQKRLARMFFQHHIQQRSAPNRGECEALIAAHPGVFKNLSWQKIKVHIVNDYRKTK